MRLVSIFLFILLVDLPVHAAEGIALYNELSDCMVAIKASTTTASKGRVAVREQQGAGVIIDPKGVIATNTHIIFGAQYVQVILETGEKLNARIVYISPNQDLALLKITPPHPLPAITWADSDRAGLGDEVITFGHSELLKSTISGGHVRSIGFRQGDTAQIPEFLELDINHYPGDSGGPVFTRQGHFLGLMHAKRMDKNRASFVVPSNKIRAAYLSHLNLADPL